MPPNLIHLATITILVSAGIFAVDVIFFPIGVAIGVLYVLPVLISLRSRQRAFVFSVAAAASMTRTPSGITSRPMPSPGISAILCSVMDVSITTMSR